jgi:hypothetical protein
MLSALQRPEAGDIGGFLSGAGTALEATQGAAGLVSGGLGLAGGGLGSAANLVGGGSSMREGNYAAGLGDLAAGVGGIAPMFGLGDAAGLGLAGGVAQTLGHGMQAYQNYNDPKSQGQYADNPFWNEIGATGLGLANTAASLDPTGVSSMAVAGGSALVNGLGAASGRVLGDDYSFSAASALGAGAHLATNVASTAYNVGSSVVGGLGSLYNWARS